MSHPPEKRSASDRRGNQDRRAVPQSDIKEERRKQTRRSGTDRREKS